MKKIKSFLVLWLCLLIGGLPNLTAIMAIEPDMVNDTLDETVASVSDLPKADAYKAIVKIKTFISGIYFNLEPYSSGSGIIINSNGLILTNYHVVSYEKGFNNTLADSTYQICVSTNIEEEPDCLYTAKLIARDKDLDMALLQIQNISGLSDTTSFSYLNLKQTDDTSVNDELIALGYPGIGGDTITITKGIISGKSEKYNKKWIKTDAIISFGSSGGAAIDNKGEVVGITSAGHSDLAGSLGYIINADSINNWVNSNKNKAPQNSDLLNSLVDFTKKTEKLKTTNLFINDKPSFAITKPADWDFTYKSENKIQIDKQSDDAGGSMSVTTMPLPYIATIDDIVPTVKYSLAVMGAISMFRIKDNNIEINGHKGKEVILSIAGRQESIYFFPAQNYLIKIQVDYGDDEKDKKIVDGILNSLTIGNNKFFTETKKYSQGQPQFFLTSNDDWSMMNVNSEQSPLIILNKKNKNVRADMTVQKIDEKKTGKTNESYATFVKQSIQDINKMGYMLDIKVEELINNPHYKLNNELKDVVVDGSITRSISTGEVVIKEKEYTIISGDKLIQISLTAYNEKDFDNMLSSFEQLSSNLSLKGFLTPTATIANTTNTTSNNQNNDSVIKVKNKKMYKQLQGKILVKPEDSGKAYYVNPKTETMHYLGRPADAFQVMRSQGVGITNANLEKIPVGLNSLSGTDTDNDGLSDAIEDALGTDKNKADSDDDGYNDISEITNGYKPNGSGKTVTDKNFSNAQKGKIFLQTEGKGEAWYINPTDGKRYFLGNPSQAFKVMQVFGSGISNKDFDNF